MAGMMWRVAPTLVLLHGFTQTRRSWRRTVQALGGRYRALAPDLPGHGQAGHRVASFDACTRATSARARAGARSRSPATRWAAASRCTPRSTLREQIDRLVLIGASPGLADPAERARPPRRRRGAGRAHRGDRRGGVRARVGARSRCSPASRSASRPPRTPTGCATRPRASPRRCAASARARWSRCGTACRSSRSRSRWSSASATRSSARSPSGWRARLPDAAASSIVGRGAGPRGRSLEDGRRRGRRQAILPVGSPSSSASE